MQRLDALLDPPGEREPLLGDSNQGNVTNMPYASGRKSIRQCFSFRESLKRDVAENGGLRECWQDQISQLFGAEFLDSLRRWTPANPVVLRVAKQLAFHADTYNLPLPSDLTCGPEVVADPQQHVEMVLKLIDEKTRHLSEIQQLRRSGGAEGGNTVDPTPRYLRAATRELQRAVDWYLHLLDSGL